MGAFKDGLEHSAVRPPKMRCGLTIPERSPVSSGFDEVHFVQREYQGESTCFVLYGSYGQCGGLNFAQPDISKTKIVEMNEADWKSVIVRNEKAGHLKHVEPNFTAYMEALDEEGTAAEESSAGILRNVECSSASWIGNMKNSKPRSEGTEDDCRE